MDSRSNARRFGIVIYPGVEPIDIGGTMGVISMARRVLPGIRAVTIAAKPGPLALSDGLVIHAQHGFDDAPPCDQLIVCGGPGWSAAAEDFDLRAFLRRQPFRSVASVCTGALILAASGLLDERSATTRRHAVGSEPHSPLALLPKRGKHITASEAVVIDSGVVTGGGVSLAIDTTLYLIGRFYGERAREEVARVIEYDRAWAANRAALGLEQG